MAERAFAFTVGQAVVVASANPGATVTKGKVVECAAESDAVRLVEVTSRNIGQFEGHRPGDRVEVSVPVNAYRVEFMGDNGRSDSAWWHEDMLVAA